MLKDDSAQPLVSNNQQTTTNTPPPVLEDVVLPPLTPDNKPTATSQQPSESSGSAAPSDDIVMPTTPISSNPRKKFAGGKVIATILGLFLLVGGLGAGVMLTQQNQNIGEKAGGCAPGDLTSPGCLNERCQFLSGQSQQGQEAGCSISGKTCTAEFIKDCSNWGGGGGGGCRADTVNCPPGSVVDYNQPLYNYCRDVHDEGSSCTGPGSAQKETGCCVASGKEGCGNPQYTTYNCCPADAPSVCTDTTSNYTKNITWPTNPTTACWEYDTFNNLRRDTYVSHTNTNCRVERVEQGEGQKAKRETVCDATVTCTKVVRTCVCVPSCVSSAPSAPSLITPANGSTVATQQVTLSWNTSSQTWGVGCPSNTDQFRLILGTSIGSMGLAGTYAKNIGATTFNGISGNTYYWRIDATNSSITTPSVIRSFTINVPPAITTPWWQVKDGDVTASNGDIRSIVPATKYFNIDGVGTFPGVPVYSGGLSYNPGLLSSKNWSANTTTTQGRIFDYSYFENLIPDDVVSDQVYSDGYEWIKRTGDVVTNTWDFQNRKIILFVDGNVTINGNINVNDGVGFFGLFVKGNITVKPSVSGTPALEGIYLSDGAFTSEVAATQLHVRGSIASYGGITLGRNLVDDSIAAELFEYAPDQILLFPKKLAYRRTKWSEIAP